MAERNLKVYKQRCHFRNSELECPLTIKGKNDMQKCFDVRGYGRVGVFIDGNPGRGMGGIDDDYTVFRVGFGEVLADLVGDIDHLDVTIGPDIYCFKTFHKAPRLNGRLNGRING